MSISVQDVSHPVRLHCNAVTRYSFVVSMILGQDPEQKIWRLRFISDSCVGMFLDAHMYMHLLFFAALITGKCGHKILGVVCALFLFLCPFVNIFFLTVISLAMLFYLIALVVWLINLCLVAEAGPFRTMIKSDALLSKSENINAYVEITVDTLQNSFLKVQACEQAQWMLGYIRSHSYSATDTIMFCVYGKAVERIWSYSVPLAFFVQAVIFSLTVVCVIYIHRALGIDI
jgi:hypothetical protein